MKKRVAAFILTERNAFGESVLSVWGGEVHFGADRVRSFLALYVNCVKVLRAFCRNRVEPRQPRL